MGAQGINRHSQDNISTIQIGLDASRVSLPAMCSPWDISATKNTFQWRLKRLTCINRIIFWQFKLHWMKVDYFFLPIKRPSPYALNANKIRHHMNTFRTVFFWIGMRRHFLLSPCSLRFHSMDLLIWSDKV